MRLMLRTSPVWSASSGTTSARGSGISATVAAAPPAGTIRAQVSRLRYSGSASAIAATSPGSALTTARITRPRLAPVVATVSMTWPRWRFSVCAAAWMTRSRSALGTRSILLSMTTNGFCRATSVSKSSFSYRLMPRVASKTSSRKSASAAAARAISRSASPTSPAASAPGVSITAKSPVSASWVRRVVPGTGPTSARSFAWVMSWL